MERRASVISTRAKAFGCTDLRAGRGWCVAEARLNLHQCPSVKIPIPFCKPSWMSHMIWEIELDIINGRPALRDQESRTVPALGKHANDSLVNTGTECANSRSFEPKLTVHWTDIKWTWQSPDFHRLPWSVVDYASQLEGFCSVKLVELGHEKIAECGELWEAKLARSELAGDLGLM